MLSNTIESLINDISKANFAQKNDADSISLTKSEISDVSDKNFPREISKISEIEDSNCDDKSKKIFLNKEQSPMRKEKLFNNNSNSFKENKNAEFTISKMPSNTLNELEHKGNEVEDESDESIFRKYDNNSFKKILINTKNHNSNNGNLEKNSLRENINKNRNILHLNDKINNNENINSNTNINTKYKADLNKKSFALSPIKNNNNNNINLMNFQSNQTNSKKINLNPNNYNQDYYIKNPINNTNKIKNSKLKNIILPMNINKLKNTNQYSSNKAQSSSKKTKTRKVIKENPTNNLLNGREKRNFNGGNGISNEENYHDEEKLLMESLHKNDFIDQVKKIVTKDKNYLEGYSPTINSNKDINIKSNYNNKILISQRFKKRYPVSPSPKQSNKVIKSTSRKNSSKRIIKLYDDAINRKERNRSLQELVKKNIKIESSQIKTAQKSEAMHMKSIEDKIKFSTDKYSIYDNEKNENCLTYFKIAQVLTELNIFISLLKRKDENKNKGLKLIKLNQNIIPNERKRSLSRGNNSKDCSNRYNILSRSPINLKKADSRLNINIQKNQNNNQSNNQTNQNNQNIQINSIEELKANLLLPNNDTRRNEELDFLDQLWILLNPKKTKSIPSDVLSGFLTIILTKTSETTMDDLVKVVQEYLSTVNFLHSKPLYQDNNNNIAKGVIRISSDSFISPITDKSISVVDIWPLKKLIKNLLNFKNGIISIQSNVKAKLKEQSELQNKKTCPFMPKLISNDLGMKSKIGKSEEYEIIKSKVLAKLKENELNMQEEEFKNCTFKPEVNTKFNATVIVPRDKNQTFEQLYKGHQQRLEKRQKIIDSKEKQRKIEEKKLFKPKINKIDLNKTFNASKIGNYFNYVAFDDYTKRNRMGILEKFRNKYLLEERFPHEYEKVKRERAKTPDISDMRRYNKKKKKLLEQKKSVISTESNNKVNSSITFKNEKKDNILLDNKDDEDSQSDGQSDYFELKLTNRKGEIIPVKVYENDLSADVAQKFCLRYGFNKEVEKKLCAYIEKGKEHFKNSISNKYLNSLEEGAKGINSNSETVGKSNKVSFGGNKDNEVEGKSSCEINESIQKNFEVSKNESDGTVQDANKNENQKESENQNQSNQNVDNDNFNKNED